MDALGKAMRETISYKMRKFLILLFIIKGKERTEALHVLASENGVLLPTYFHACQTQGWMELPESGGYRITDEGMKIIEEGLGDDNANPC